MRKKIWLPVILAAACLAAAWFGMAAEPKVIETNWTWQQYHAKTSTSASTHSVTGVGFAYGILPVGASVEYHLKFTTRSYAAGVTATSVTTSVQYLPAGQPFSSDFEAFTINPTLVITSLDTSATAYVWINYGVRKEQ